MGNPFVCDCNFRQVLIWKNTTTVSLSNFNSYACNGPKEWTGKSLTDFSKSEINCTFYTSYAIYGSLLFGIVFSLFVYNLMYSRRWTIRLFRYRLSKRIKSYIRRWLGEEAQLAPEGQFDAYVSCSEHDKEWALKHLLPGIDNGELNADHPFGGRFRLYYEDRDAVPGAPKFDNINSFLEKSKKVIIILSEHYMQAPTMAENSMELGRANIMLHERDIEDIIVIQLGDVAADNVPAELYTQMKKERFLQWEDDLEAIEHFKENLVDRLQAELQD